MSWKKFTLGVLYVIFTIIVGVILAGYALSTVWNWFMVPTFDLPLLDIPTALGIGALLGYYSTDTSDLVHKKEESVTMILVKFTTKIILKPLFLLFIGLILLQFK